MCFLGLHHRAGQKLNPGERTPGSPESLAARTAVAQAGSAQPNKMLRALKSMAGALVSLMGVEKSCLLLCVCVCVYAEPRGEETGVKGTHARETLPRRGLAAGWLYGFCAGSQRPRGGVAGTTSWRREDPCTAPLRLFPSAVSVRSLAFQLCLYLAAVAAA